MKRSSFVSICLIALTAISAVAAPNPSTAKVSAFPGILANARYVYVSSYDVSFGRPIHNDQLPSLPNRSLHSHYSAPILGKQGRIELISVSSIQAASNAAARYYGVARTPDLSYVETILLAS